MRYAYYPGCSLDATAKQYGESIEAVAGTLGVELAEVDDWNCCGATAYMSIDEAQAAALACRNLALAERAGSRELVAPCSACYLVLNKTQRYLQEYPHIRQRVSRGMAAAGLTYRGSVTVRHPLEVLVNDIGIPAIKAKVTRPLDGVKVAPYYGCQIVRPYALFDDQHDPKTMDNLLEAVGAEVVDYPFKTRCCGGSQTGTIPDVGLDLVYQLLEMAHQKGAEMVTTICPLCQFNLDVFQADVRRVHGTAPMPVVYITQLLGWALGIPGDQLGLKRSIVPAEPVLTRRTADVV